MKKLTLSLAAIMVTVVVLLSSCGKATTGGSNSGTVSFTAGGTNYSYSAGTGLVGHTSSNMLQFVKNETNNSQNVLSFVGGHNASGTYSFDYTTSLTWNINSKSYSSTNGSGNPNGSMSVTISGATATATFSSTLYNIASPATDSMIVTNGSYSGSYFVTQ